MPTLFATMGIAIAHVFRMVIKQPLTLGMYALFSILCAGASPIAVPAVQRLAILEASPTLPLAVTIGIPMSIEIARYLKTVFPVT